MSVKKNWAFYVFFILTCLATSEAYPGGSKQFTLSLGEQSGYQIKFYAFDTFTLIESVPKQQKKNRLYETKIAPPLKDPITQKLACYEDPFATSTQLSCDESPVTEPDFSTCDDMGCVGPMCPHSCVEVWDYGSFYLTVTYSSSGVPEIEVEEKDDDESDDEEDSK